MNQEECQTASPRRAPSPTHVSPRPLLINTLWAIGGTGFYQACQLGVLILLAKLATPEIQGQYFLGLAIATPVSLFFGLELRAALVADAGNQFSFGTYRVLRQVMMVPAGLVLAGALAWQARHEGRVSYLAILTGVFAARIIWSLAEVGWGTFQRRERLDLLAAAVILRGLTLILPFAALLPICAALSAAGRLSAERLPQGAAAAIGLHALGALAVLLLFDRPRVMDRKSCDLSWNWRSVGALAWQTLPLGAVALIINLCDSYPRLVFESPRVADGKAQLGYFGALAYVTMAGNLIVIQAATAAANRLSLYYCQRDLKAFLRLGGLLAGGALAIGGTMLTVALLFGRWILTVLYTPDYARFETEFRIIVLAHCLALLTNVFGAVTTQMRLFWMQVPAQVITLLCTVAAALALIPGPTPVLGAAQTSLVRATVQLVSYSACLYLGLRRQLEAPRPSPDASPPPEGGPGQRGRRDSNPQPPA